MGRKQTAAPQAKQLRRRWYATVDDFVYIYIYTTLFEPWWIQENRDSRAQTKIESNHQFCVF